jgi:signal transduction histidine kinase
MTAANPHDGGARIPASVVRLSVGIACAIVGVLVELGLDQVVGVAPWLIVAFSAGIVAAILGGLTGGTVAAAIGFVAQVVVVRASFASLDRPDGIPWPLDLTVAGSALLVGLWIRSVLLGRGDRRRSLDSGRTAALPARLAESGDVLVGADQPVPLAHALLAGVRDLGTARTPVQVSDALARHVVAISGAPGAIVYLHADDSAGFIARGRFGAPDPDAPERIIEVGARGPRSGQAADPAGVIGGRPSDRVLQLPFGRGSVPAGIIRFAGRSDAAHQATPAVDPMPDPRAGPLVELLCLVAADALGRTALTATNRSAERDASVAAGRVTVLARLTAALVRATTVDEVSRTLVDFAVDDLGAGFAVVHVPVEETGRYRLVDARGYPAGLAARESVTGPGTSGPVARAAEAGVIVEIHGEDGWRTAFPSASNVPAITGVRAISSIPMRAAGGLQGVLVIGWRDEADQAAADRDLLTTAADQGGQAVERAILQAHDEDARRFQEAFIAVVSHELRTPITTIVAGSRILSRRLVKDPRSAEVSNDIEAEADRLSRIVDDLLVLSRLERRHLTLGDEPVHLDHLLARIVGSESARWPGHRMEVVSASASHLVRGDETYIEQVLRNLISNAAKYSPQGSLVEVAIDESPAGEILVSVRDRGPGVAPAEVDELFSLFYRSPTTAASAAGAGIGLFVSRRLVAEMGGRMWASPRPDGGSEFGFALAPYPVDAGDPDEEAIAEATARATADALGGGTAAAARD